MSGIVGAPLRCHNTINPSTVLMLSDCHDVMIGLMNCRGRHSVTFLTGIQTVVDFSEFSNLSQKGETNFSFCTVSNHVWDCVVFIFQYVECISRRVEADSPAKGMPFFRKENGICFQATSCYLVESNFITCDEKCDVMTICV